jgi:hypothetical protein
MSGFFKDVIKALARFWESKIRRRLFILIVLCIVALVEFIALGIARRTYVFYTIDSGVLGSGGSLVVEDRMLKRSPSREINLTRYVEEALLGPVAPDLLPMFPRETKLRSLLYRSGVVYIDFSIDAALPPEEGGESLSNFRTLYEGILRNFTYVRDVRFFIAGNAAFAHEFLYIEEEAL